MLRYYGQPKYAGAAPTHLVGYELLLREYAHATWQRPTDFNAYSSATIAHLLAQTLATIPQTLPLVSFNLSQRQFVDPNFCRALATLQANRPMNLYVELTETAENVPITALVAAAKAFGQLGVVVVIDDVGSGANQLCLVRALRPYTGEYKFALQNFRAKLTRAQLRQKLLLWRKRATADHKLFALEGVEHCADLALVTLAQPDVVQGYYYGRPILLNVAGA
ncbi:EAL domain-containing protein [Lacticaseibacillus daqingensis]|uniref:EAL domain-containing protein n=1 Tax=Lacticaseibacillus daqingensis TaxID=2486014 RepID=UPI000F7A1764|nr:EAL domain-containing protein [Lacticaseibacillus daqingensis]